MTDTSTAADGWTAPSPTEALSAVHRHATARGKAREDQEAAMAHANDAGVTWAAIADAAGLTYQGAQKAAERHRKRHPGCAQCLRTTEATAVPIRDDHGRFSSWRYKPKMPTSRP